MTATPDANEAGRGKHDPRHPLWPGPVKGKRGTLAYAYEKLKRARAEQLMAETAAARGEGQE